MCFRVFTIVILLLNSMVLFCQTIEEKDFTRYTFQQGLSDNYISGITQDSSGFMWIATRRGLNRFDGKQFRHFFQNDKYNPIPDNSVYSITQIKNQELAIATNDGAQIISAKTLKQLNLNIADDVKLRYWSNSCMYINNDAAGNYGVSTKTGFYIFSSAGKLIKRYDQFTRKDIGEWMLFGEEVYCLPDGNLVQVNKKGLLLYNRQTQQFSNATTKYPGLAEVEKKINNLFFFITDSEFIHINVETNSFDLVNLQKGKLASFPSCIPLHANVNWMSTGSRINDTTWAINCQTKGFFLITLNPKTRYFSCSPQRYFADKFCTVIFTDKTNNLWIGTNEGLYKQNAGLRLVETFKLLNEKPDNHITALKVFKDKIIAGTINKEIHIFNKYTKQLIRSIQLPVHPILTNNTRMFHVYSSDTLWIGTNSGFFWLHLQNFSLGRFEINKDIPLPFIYLFFEDKNKNSWVSDNQMNSIYYHDSKTNSFVLIDNKSYPLFRTNVTSIAEDKSGNIWIGGDAIVRWNPVTQNIDTLIEHLSTQRNFKKGYHIMADSKGDIWAKVNDDGLARLTGNSIHIRPGDLFTGNSFYMMPALFNDRIFLYTPKGAGYFDIRSFKTILFTESDGIPHGPATSSFFTEDPSDGSVWFAVKNTICKLPVLTSSNNLKPPAINITAISILNDTLLNYPPNRIILNHTQGDINIYYSAINFTDPDNMQFSYRIKNKRDSMWIDAEDRQNILLTNISPGNYKVEIRVAAYDNKWPEQIKELEIEMKPPFWNTGFFYAAIIFVIATFVWLLHKYRIRQIKQREGLDKLIAQTEMKALQSQMNPHFIFNSLNSIKAMILNNNNTEASRYLSKFAHLMRLTLSQSDHPFVTLKNTIEYLERYIEMEHIRNEIFTYSISVDNSIDMDKVYLHPMLIQPLIENAIWHGTDEVHNNLHIAIEFKPEGDMLVCTVDDNGIGVERSLQQKEHSLNNHNSLGIKNIKNRIALLNEKYDLESSLTIIDKSANAEKKSGTLAILKLSVKNQLYETHQNHLD